MSGSQPSPLSATLQRACDQCNARKIRCDKLQPCSHCKAAGLSCRTTLQRPKQQRDRVMVSKQYENKIDRIEARLVSIERILLERLPPSAQADNTPSRHGVPTGATIEVDGYTGPHADSLAAKEAFEQAAEVSPTIASDKSLSEALSSLRGIIDRIKADDHGFAPSGVYSEDLPLPTWDDIKHILESAANQPPPVVKTFFPTLDLISFHQLCTKLYKNDQDGTIFERLMAYSGLSVLCSDFSAAMNGSQSENNHYMARCFSQHMLKTVDVMPAIMTASWTGLEAALTASFACLELCKPQLGMTLTAIAARFCQALGYNRLPLQDVENQPDRQRKILMFWQVYIYDRNTALRIGRPPSIPEYDVSTECMTPNRFPYYTAPVIYLHQFWAHIADVQGAISQKLYSPVGIRQSPEQRIRLVKALAAKLQSAWIRRQQVNDEVETLHSQLGPNSFTAQCIRVGDEIAYYSTLTLVMHALSPAGKPNLDAVEAARACLRAYKSVTRDEVDNVYTWSGFCHCVTLYSPLTPFTVLFQHVINDHENGHVDLQLLDDFVESLKPARQVSEGINSFYTLCLKFYQIAEAYISAKNQESVVYEFDNYLSTLGLMPQTTGYEDPYAMPGMDQDWYAGNVSLYGLIEDGSGVGNFDNMGPQ